ncbi:MAG: THUMP domain-containing class I SAM-dependent RNA methyltransferase, partial [Bacteroidota bacterium]
MEDKPKFPMIAKTLTGLEKVLARELADLGASNIKPQRRAVSFEGDKKLMYKANLWSRAALSILKPIKEFPFDTQEDYYDRLRALPWDEYFSVTNTFSITAVASQSVFINTHFLAQRTKDAIVDFFREKTNSRPQVDIENPDVKIQIYIYKDICSVLLDS